MRKKCFDKVQDSVERWGRFVLWNSSNLESPDPIIIDDFPYLHKHNLSKYKKTNPTNLLHR